jgi:hypothetical protein
MKTKIEKNQDKKRKLELKKISLVKLAQVWGGLPRTRSADSSCSYNCTF